MTDDLLNIVRFDTPTCPGCGKVDKQLFSELVGKKSTTCIFCRGTIPLTDQTWRVAFQALAEDVREQYRK